MKTRLGSRLLIAGIVVSVVSGTGVAWAHGDEEHNEAAEAAEQEAPKSHVIEGEVVDLACYIAHARDGRGKKHKACAQDCIKKGLPVGLLAKETLYLLVGSNHEAANATFLPYAASTVKIRAKLHEQNGMKLAVVEEILTVDGKRPAAASASKGPTTQPSEERHH